MPSLPRLAGMEVVNFGAFVNLLSGEDGLVDVSGLKSERVEKPGNVVAGG